MRLFFEKLLNFLSPQKVKMSINHDGNTLTYTLNELLGQGLTPPKDIRVKEKIPNVIFNFKGVFLSIKNLFIIFHEGTRLLKFDKSFQQACHDHMLDVVAGIKPAKGTLKLNCTEQLFSNPYNLVMIMAGQVDKNKQPWLEVSCRSWRKREQAICFLREYGFMIM